MEDEVEDCTSCPCLVTSFCSLIAGLCGWKTWRDLTFIQKERIKSTWGMVVAVNDVISDWFLVVTGLLGIRIHAFGVQIADGDVGLALFLLPIILIANLVSTIYQREKTLLSTIVHLLGLGVVLEYYRIPDDWSDLRYFSAVRFQEAVFESVPCATAQVLNGILNPRAGGFANAYSLISSIISVGMTNGFYFIGASKFSFFQKVVLMVFCKFDVLLRPGSPLHLLQVRWDTEHDDPLDIYGDPNKEKEMIDRPGRFIWRDLHMVACCILLLVKVCVAYKLPLAPRSSLKLRTSHQETHGWYIKTISGFFGSGSDVVFKKVDDKVYLRRTICETECTWSVERDGEILLSWEEQDGIFADNIHNLAVLDPGDIEEIPSTLIGSCWCCPYCYSLQNIIVLILSFLQVLFYFILSFLNVAPILDRWQESNKWLVQLEILSNGAITIMCLIICVNFDAPGEIYTKLGGYVKWLYWSCSLIYIMCIPIVIQLDFSMRGKKIIRGDTIRRQTRFNLHPDMTHTETELQLCDSIETSEMMDNEMPVFTVCISKTQFVL